MKPFTRFQIDTKYILDKTALPKDVYEHILRYNLPRYEWNAVDVKTRTRFTAYSYELSAVSGFAFLLLIVLWCRVNNVKDRIEIRTDNGREFCMGSNSKLRQYNEFFSIFNTEIKPIPVGAKHLQGIVENSHRKDDEYFLSIYPKKCRTNMEFIEKAQEWQDTWNTARPHYGIDMNGFTPFMKFLSLPTLISSNIFKFPVLLMEDLLKMPGYPWEWLNKFLNLFIISKGGKYVYTTCQQIYINV